MKPYNYEITILSQNRNIYVTSNNTLCNKSQGISLAIGKLIAYKDLNYLQTLFRYNFKNKYCREKHELYTDSWR